jgi:hypothetical protein
MTTIKEQKQYEKVGRLRKPIADSIRRKAAKIFLMVRYCYGRESRKGLYSRASIPRLLVLVSYAPTSFSFIDTSETRKLC